MQRCTFTDYLPPDDSQHFNNLPLFQITDQSETGITLPVTKIPPCWGGNISASFLKSRAKVWHTRCWGELKQGKNKEQQAWRGTRTMIHMRGQMLGCTELHSRAWGEVTHWSHVPALMLGASRSQSSPRQSLRCPRTTKPILSESSQPS